MATRKIRIVFNILGLDSFPRIPPTPTLSQALCSAFTSNIRPNTTLFREHATTIYRAHYAERMIASHKKCILCGSSATTVSMSPMSYLHKEPDPFIRVFTRPAARTWNVTTRSVLRWSRCERSGTG